MATRINTAQSIEVIYRLGEHLNQIIRTSGQIQRDNPLIWNEVLHQMDNATWRGVLETLDQLITDHPQLANLNHYSAIQCALEALTKYEDYYDKVLDMRNRHINHKPLAWKALMTLRELYTSAVGQHLPNADSSRVASTYEELFQ